MAFAVGTFAEKLRGSPYVQEVSWAEIGKTLGITRQAAWQRFGAADSVGE